MDNSEFDYSLHYLNWHPDTKESLDKDVKYAEKLFSDHGIFPAKKDARILELGCGMGRFLLMLQHVGYSILTGVDIDKTLVGIAKRTGLDIRLSDVVEWLENNEDKFDMIYFFDLLEHIDNERQLHFLRLVNAHLFDDGMVALMVPNALAPCAMYQRYIDFTHRVSYTETSLRFILANAGFNYVDVRHQYRERGRVRKLKIPHAELLEREFGLENIILTPNLFAVGFKKETAYEQYNKNAPIITNPYIPHPYKSKLKRFRMYLKSVGGRLFASGKR